MLTMTNEPGHLDGPLRATGRRRRTVGFDLWAAPRTGRPLDPPTVQAKVRSTHLRLTNVHRPDEAEGAVRLRFLARDEDAHITDAAIGEVLHALGESLAWSRLEKLDELDHIPDYLPLPTP